MSKSQDQYNGMSTRALLLTLVCSLLASVVIVFVALLPAEYGRDPTGFGQWSGLSRLWAPQERLINPNTGEYASAHAYEIPFRSDVIAIELDSMDRSGGRYEIEYKVHMQKNASLVFEWEAIGTQEPEDFYYDFHGHTLVQTGVPKTDRPKDYEDKSEAPASDGSMTVAIYKQDSAQSARGALVAPFDGIHGWYFQNSAAGKVTVRLRISGFYDLIPVGEPGNEAGILPQK